MEEKTVLITGASRGIGQAIATRFARPGFRLALNCRSSQEDLFALQARLAGESGVPCLCVMGDVGRYDSVEKMFHQIHQAFGGVDILINNAGVSYYGLFSEMGQADWQYVMDTNLSSVFYCCKFAIPHMVRQQSGKIINISSVWGLRGASMEVAYSASKGGVNSLTKALAKELAPSNIQVNALACGVVDTQMNRLFNEEERKALAEDIPAGRFADSGEVAELAWDLATKHDYLTGQVIALDGGWG